MLDTTVLSNFAHVQRPHLIRSAMGETAFTTPIVMAELDKGVKGGWVPDCNWSWLQVLEPDKDVIAMASEFRRILDAGEAESLAMAKRQGCVFLSDDFAARRLASKQGVKVSGTLGVLIKLVKSGEIELSEANTLLQGMISKGYRSPVSNLSELLL